MLARSTDPEPQFGGDHDPGQRGRMSTGAEPEDGLAHQLSVMARSLQADPTVEETLQGIVRAALVNIPSARHAGITMVDRSGRVSTPAATDDFVELIDQLQYQVRQGPCLTSIREQATVRADDLSSETRWPAFAARAVELGVRSMLSFQLFVDDHDLGALNLYSTQAQRFDEMDEQIGLLLAGHAAIAMVGAQNRHNFAVALDTRDLIGQAKGILMERHKITAKQAFELLVRASQMSNRKLHEIAADLADTGQMPPR